MTFEKPTTKAQMYEILQQIYHYYRVQREGYAGTELEELNLQRMEFTPLTEQEILLKAKTLLGGKKQREISEYQSQIKQEIAGLNAKINLLESQRQTAIKDITNLYSESQAKITAQVEKNGLYGSTILVNQLTKLETEKNSKIAEANAKYAENKAIYLSQITQLEVKENQTNELFSAIYEKEEIAKGEELKDSQAELEKTVFKYNNSLDEREIKYRNMMAKTNLELRLKFMEIQSGEFSKEELVDMGYYEDAFNCVTDYYNSLQPLSAYQDILQEERLIVFLDDYYQNILYMYKMRADA